MHMLIVGAMVLLSIGSNTTRSLAYDVVAAASIATLRQIEGQLFTYCLPVPKCFQGTKGAYPVMTIGIGVEVFLNTATLAPTRTFELILQLFC